MGCNSSVNVQVDETGDSRPNNQNNTKKIIVNGKEVENKNTSDRIVVKDEDESNIQKNNNNENSIKNSKITTINFNKDNSNINYKTNQSTNFKYMKNEFLNNQKNNYSTVFNQNEGKSMDKFIIIKHPLDRSIADKEIEIHQISPTIGEKNKKNDEQDKIEENSIEDRINNFNCDDGEDGVNFGNGGDDDDMCNLELSTEMKNKKENESKEINVTFDIQLTGQKFIIGTKTDIKLNDLIEIFMKKSKLNSFEKPEFVFDTVFLTDYNKTLSSYKIGDGDKINVFI